MAKNKVAINSDIPTLIDRNTKTYNSKMAKWQKNIRADFLYAKIHRARVTDSNLNYVGSISLDSRLMQASGILEGMKVEILNVNNGERFSTYAIKADTKEHKQIDSASETKNDKKTKDNAIFIPATVCLNGAAARKVQQGDIVIILAYVNMKLKYAKDIKPRIIFVDSSNRITKIQR